MMLSAVYFNKNGHVEQFYRQMDRLCLYYNRTTAEKTKGTGKIKSEATGTKSVQGFSRLICLRF